MTLTKNLLLAGFVLAAAFSATQKSVSAQEPAVPQTRISSPSLAPGDEVDVRMYDLPDLSGGLKVHVAPNGVVYLPYAGAVQAEGLSPDAFREAVVEALKSRGIVKDPNVSVEIVTAVNMVVHVMGQVRTPRSVPVYSSVPIAYVLGEVGGTTGLAAHHLTIVHPSDEPPTTLDYDPDAPTSKTMNTLVQPGDIVNVSNNGVYFVAGEVLRPGIFPIGGALTVGGATPQAGGIGVVKDMTLLQALTQAGGITAIAARSKMHILRTENGKRIEIVVDQVKLSNGQVADPLIHANDIIYVPSSYIRAQTNNLFSTVLTSLYAGLQLHSVSSQ